ncbi:MAG TPA: indolepyruvate oxidoreductase subunit beta [Bacteroidales bacterium]|nr:MAG: indolepyruvate oxidoreductase [Bacteroidetes bacterium GWF2_33_38]OFY76723.1 MAG: indolepyruvate oxidoreductase [Bacteroidetes bacterium RIFOXYA12_FULL_33_9]OFY88565.1 MAG: indolepyruvate oxidoreductase [Bacteroidetes bacterium RIFOXYA2_FULL_33_7]HBF87147.1 indolepyruvate oxidoreductase subunit beta [Bacteroidales bacterium]
MKTDIILAGVGGQGILSIAASIGMAALKINLHLKQAEVHGMSQRGGDVQSHLRISDKEIASDLIPKGKADIIISVEPMESLRYLPYLSPTGWIVTNTKPFINIPNYPELENVMNEIKKQKNYIMIDADSIANELGSARSSNMVMLGAASPFLNISFETLEQGIRDIFGRKGEEVVNVNLAALKAGRDFAEKNR